MLNYISSMPTTMSKIKTIVFEGADLSGKGTIKRRFDVMTNYKHVTYDRGIITNIVYNEMYQRNLDLQKSLWDELNNSEYLYVWVYADLIQLQSRWDTRGDDIQSREGLETVFNIYYKVMTQYRKAFIFLNNTIDDQVQYMNKLIKEVENGRQDFRNYISPNRKA